MAETAIEWTQRSWNPVVGCSLATPGCTNCYAMAMAARIERMDQGAGKVPHYAGLTQQAKAGPVWTGKLAMAPENVLLEPLRRRKPTTYFVNSMGDLFHDDVPDAWIDRVFAVMALAPQHAYQALTKRAARMRAYLADPRTPRRVYELACDMTLDLKLDVVLIAPGADEKLAPPGPRIYLDRWPLPNVWLGVSAEDQKRAEERVPDLLATPAAIRFVSAEPLLGPIDFSSLDINGDGEMDAMKARAWLDEIEQWRGTSPTWKADFLDWFNLSKLPTGGNMHTVLNWIIVGGESGPKARPMHPDWPRQIRDQCAAAGTAFFFKQWGEWRPNDVRGVGVDRMAWVRDDGLVKPWTHTLGIDAPQAERDRWKAAGRAGKKIAGRLLDGVEHNAMPEVR